VGETDFSAETALSTEITLFAETGSSEMTDFSEIGSAHVAGGALVSERDLQYEH